MRKSGTGKPTWGKYDPKKLPHPLEDASTKSVNN
jgi:hypothetical protein